MLSHRVRLTVIKIEDFYAAETLDAIGKSVIRHKKREREREMLRKILGPRIDGEVILRLNKELY